MKNVGRISLTILIAAAFPVLCFANIKIAITGPFSGGSAPMGTSMRDGAKLAIEAINARGGVAIGGAKQKIEVVERDDEGVTAGQDRCGLMPRAREETEEPPGGDLNIPVESR